MDDEHDVEDESADAEDVRFARFALGFGEESELENENGCGLETETDKETNRNKPVHRQTIQADK